MQESTRSRNSDEEPNNSDDIKVWDSENKHLFSVLRLTTTGHHEMVERFGLRLQTKVRSLLASVGVAYCYYLNQEMVNQEMVERFGLR